jgi:tetratricopeptide (TPR) repeat protein
MERTGAKAVNFGQTYIHAGDRLASPEIGVNLKQTPESCNLMHDIVLTPTRFLSTFDASSGACFYASVLGPLPYGWISQSLQEYLVLEVTEAFMFPDPAEGYLRQGKALANKGDLLGARGKFELALKINPAFARARYELGFICFQQQRPAASLAYWREAARLSPDWPDPLNTLAWVLATDPRSELRDGQEAVRLATRAVELAGTNSANTLDTLAAAYAEVGQFDQAAARALEARELATVSGRTRLAERIEERITLYRSRQPYRQSPEAK